MDDPWANAWDESHSKNTTSSVPTKSIFSTSTWRDPAENETDIALPSWSVGPAVTWNEPSDDAPTLWGSSTSNDSPELPITSSFSPKGVDWKSSYESMSAHFGGSSVDENSETEEVGDAEESNEGEGMHDQIDVNVDEYEAVAAKGEAPGIVDPWTPPQSTFPTSTSLSSVLEITASNSPPAPRSPDAFEFGTFESGASDSLAGPSTEGKTWDSGSLSNPESEWGTAWTSKEADPNDVEDVEALDEWERAKREREKMDRVVPPEFLASILRTLEEISDDFWLPPVQAKPNDVNNVPTTDTTQEPLKDTSDHDPLDRDSPNLDYVGEREVEDVAERSVIQVEDESNSLNDESQPEETLAHWKGGIDAVEGLLDLCQTIIPPLPPLSSLPSLPSQTKSSPIMKRSSEALRLTRSTVISSSGPLGMYLKTKGSIEWEVAVKARPEKTSEQEREEIVPAGWRILPKENEDEKKVEVPEMKRKGSSILSSFFGRKAEASPTESKEKKDKEASPRPSFASSRNSVDFKSGTANAESSSTDKLPTSPVSAPVPSTSTVGASTSTTPTPSTYGDGGSPDLFHDAPTTTPAPSAVSRFLNRFSSSSRSRPSHTRQNSNTSLALSTDDLEFLQDIVPSASDIDHEHELVQTGSNELELNGLQKMINSAPLPALLSPPPRAPGRDPQQSQSQLSSPRSPSDDFITWRNASSDASRQNKNFDFASSSSQILTPSPALPSQIQTAITRSSTPSSFALPLSTRSSSPGLDMSSIAGSSVGGRASQLTSPSTGMNALGGSAISRPSSSSAMPNIRTTSSPSSTTMKRPTPVAIMSQSSGSSSKSPESADPFSFLPPPPSIRGGGKATSSPSLLIDDELPRASSSVSGVSSIPAALNIPSTSATAAHLPQTPDDDDFSDFLSATPTDVVQPPFSASNLFSLSSAQPLFSAGTAEFNGRDSEGPLDAFSARYDNPLNTSVSSIASTNSVNNVLLSSREMDPFGDSFDAFNDFASSSSPVQRDTLRTPSPPALPDKSPGKLAARRAFGAEPTSAGVSRRASTGKKTMGGSGVGGRIPPGRLNLPAPVSSSAYSRHWGSAAHEPSPSVLSGNSVNSASPLVASSSEPALAVTPASSPSPKTHQKRVSKEAHQRTRSLVEDAMARSGIWPSLAPSAVSSTSGYGSGYGAYGFGTAPPLSPLPPILSPPPESSSSSKNRGDLLGAHDDDDDDVPLASLAPGSTYGSVPKSTIGSFTFATQQTQAKAGLIPSISSISSSPPYSTNGPNLNRNGTLPPIPLPGPTPSGQQPTLLMGFGALGSGPGPSSSSGLGSSPAPGMSPQFGATLASSTSKTTTGGLSAQDLSFFEGL
ncbi:hypothetical protein EV359DRAFT_80067 [Lentinula novae-zelandiae]|nr:hypothetical protein EV359DRAFT_80067 [Lentinula novae-zelandiae]